MKNFTNLKNLSFLLLLLVFGLEVEAQTISQTYNSSGSFTVPAGITQVTVEAWGGGGKGGSRTSGSGAYGGGGGGAYARKLVTVVPNTTYTVTVGAGATNNTTNGGDSWFINNTTILAKGGTTVPNNTILGGAGGSAALSIGDVTYAGGSGSNGLLGSYGGGGGSSAGVAANGNSAILTSTGALAPVGGGNGGNGRSGGGNGNGSAGNTPGGGGGGALRTSSGSPTGGNGATGQLIITYGVPEMNVLGNAVSIVDGDVTPSLADWTDFGSATVGSPITRTFTIQNTSTTAPLAITGITFSGGASGDFAVTSAPPALIATSSSATFVVTFTPSAPGVRNTTINIQNNDPNENPYNYAIQGTGIAPEIDIQGNGLSIADNDGSPSPSDWTDFGSLQVGLNLSYTYTIYNTGNAPLTISSTTLTGAGAAAYSITSAPAASIPGGGSTTITVQFTPSGVGAFNAVLTINNNDSNEAVYNFSITGTGTPPQPEIAVSGNTLNIVDGDTTPSELDWTDFTGSSVGVGVTRTFTISNTGAANLTIPTVNITGANAGDFSITTSPASPLTAGSTTTLVITFTPGALGIRTASVRIINNDSDENPFNFDIMGTGYSPISFGPGGVSSNLQLWLRSDLLNGVTGTADGTAVNTWSTQARGSNAIRPGSVGAPVYRDNATHNINFNSVVDFTNNPATSPQNYTDLDPARQYLKGPTGFYSQDIFAVVIPDINVTSNTASLDIFCGDRVPATNQTDGSGIGYGRYTNRFTNEVVSFCLGTTSGTPPTGYGVAHVDNTGTITYNTAGIINASANATLNGENLTFNANNIVTTTNDPADFGFINNSQFWIGRSEGWDGSWDGRIGEIITLSYRASDSERSRILSYLAIKYGITLGVNGTSMNYVNSLNNIIWDAAANAGYNYDIAGIGRDDIGKLNQKQSKSINTTEVMTIGLTDIYNTNSANPSTFTTNRSYLVWGANGGNMANSGVPISVDLGPTTITTITEVVNRKWKLVETGGDVGTVRVNVPTAAFLSGLPALGPTDAYVMVVASDAAYTTGVETVFMTTSGGNQTCTYDFDGTKYITFGVAHQAVDPLHITLDGFDDFVRIDNVNELSPAFTVMTWIRPDGMNTTGTERTIIAKKAVAGSGYRLVLQNDYRVRMEWSVGGTTYSTITNTAFPNGMWHNIAVTYGTGTIRMYIDGVLDRTAAVAVAPVASASTFSIGAQYIDKTNIVNLFKGDIDELRMWSRVLTPTEIRFIMNQEIQQTGTGTRGAILPTTITKNDISGLLWANLYAYYSMNSYIGTHLDDDSPNVNRGSLVIPDKISINPQTAPLPYRSAANGLWSSTATWQNGSTQDLPYSLSIVDGTTPIEWNIVGTSHNVNSTGNKVVLGLYVSANTLSATNDSKVEVSHYFKLDGILDLEGKSQLVQTLNSDLDPTSSGSLQRDQQGQNSIYNYNYWSSPVGAINNTTNNNIYTVNGVMKDGTTSTPQNISWTSGLNGSATSPITLSSYWIFKFQNLTPAYANWASVGPNGNLFPGQGFTLKGSGAASSQNYTFVGKPNNGLITGVIAANNLNLSGNPYASAIDANAFITANSTTTTGTLYFWEHYATNATHNLAQYQGGYATRNLVGGTPPVAPPLISGLGSSSKVPGRYIPVGQGFFIFGSTTGGTVTFNNNQRAFVKEDNASSNTLFRSNSNNSILTVNHFNDNSEDEYSDEQFAKIRLGFNDRNGYHRQILLGFMNEYATSGIDAGYDAPLMDNQPGDLWFINSGTGLNICGDGYFNENNIYPLAVKSDALANVTISLDDIENFDENQNIYIYDNQTGIYHDIKASDFSVEVPLGTLSDRFSLRFINPQEQLGNDDFENSNAIQLVYTNANSMVNIKNNTTDATVEKVELYNMLGQFIKSWNVKEADQHNIQLPVKEISTGTYIVKMKTTKGDTGRKIIIN